MSIPTQKYFKYIEFIDKNEMHEQIKAFTKIDTIVSMMTYMYWYDIIMPSCEFKPWPIMTIKTATYVQGMRVPMHGD